MNNPRDAYARRRNRVGWLMTWLDAALERHYMRATQSANLWPMVGDLGHVEEELIPLLRFVSGISEEKIIKILDSMKKGGQGDE